MSHPQTTFSNVTFAANGFWGKKRTTISSVALLYQLDVLKKTGRYDAFKLKWHPVYDDAPEVWPVPNHLFWDSDVAKWIEGACYFLHNEENSTVRSNIDELVDMISSAQQPDGYLNIHFTVVEPNKRFSNLRDLHELYNAGHLIEAALAHKQLYGNTKLLDPILKYVDLLAKEFGPGYGQKHGYPGHPEVELALLRLYDKTEDPKHLDLAKFFLTERGNPKGANGEHYFDSEAKARGEGAHEVPDYYPAPRSYWYQQAHLPIVEQQTIEGHSVRAMYLLAALADLVRIEGSHLDSTYKDSLFRLWQNMVEKKMYLTGGIGATKQWEGFSRDYNLPQSTDEGGCYAETCAAIGVMMLADRLLEINRDSHFADIMELALYNAVLTGVSCNGREWTYVNQLASSDADPSQRSDWFTVACCPPNVLRLLGDLGGYLYSATNKDSDTAVEMAVHLFAAAEIVHKVAQSQIRVSMTTNWPADGVVNFEIDTPVNVNTTLFIRVPSWASKSWSMSPKAPQVDIEKGYLKLQSSFLRSTPNFTLDFPMRPIMTSPHPATGQNVVAISRGPIVYCVEDVDNDWVDDHFQSTIFHTDTAELKEELIHDPATCEEFIGITARQAASRSQPVAPEGRGPGYDLSKVANGTNSVNGQARMDLKFVPYYFRANRKGRGHMRVGLKADRGYI